MKILIIEGASAADGQAKHVHDLAIALSERGHEVAVSSGNTKYHRALRAAKVEVLSVSLKHALDIRGIVSLHRTIRQSGYDVIHTHGHSAGVAGRLAAGFAGCKKIVHTLHAASDLVSGSTISRQIASRAYFIIDRWLSRITATIIVPSDDLRRQAIQYGISNDKFVTIHLGIDLTKYKSLGDKSQARSRLAVPTGCKVVGTTGFSTKPRDVADLVQAAALVNKRFDDVFFVLVGDREDMNDIRRLAKNFGIAHKIVFANCSDNIPGALHGLDVFAISSIPELHSLTILEAMAVGLPVVAPVSASISEAISDGFTGHMLQHANPEAIANAICRIFEEDRAEAMGAAGRERVKSFFGLDRMVEQIEKVYIRQLEHKSSTVTAKVCR
jgi:glycosyltransferase involved in cell wall biosynthesis